MKIYFYILMLTSLIFSCANTKKSSGNQKPATHQTVTDSLNWQNKYGFKYTIPPHWQTTVSDLEATDLQGHIKSVEFDYKINDNANLQMVFHPGESGLKLFNTYYNSRRKNLGQTTINKLQAVKITEQILTDGKGHPLAKPVNRTKIFLLNSDKSACLELNFELKGQDPKALAAFESFLKNIKPAK